MATHEIHELWSSTNNDDSTVYQCTLLCICCYHSVPSLHEGAGKRKKSISPACSQKRKKNKGNKSQKSRDSSEHIEVCVIVK